MSDVDWPLVRKLFDAVVELPEAERAAHLGRAEVGSAVRAEVERMLRSDGSASGFLESSSPLLEKALLPQMGTRLGHYELKRVIASGGMGTVFEAVQDKPRRAVALKTLRFGLTSPERLQRFRFEAEVLGSLRHPSIAQVFEAGTHEEAGEHVPFIAMELVPGARDILSYAREEDLELAARLALFLEVCEAVQHGHQKGVIHRDLKPGNILVGAEGRAKVIDFGVARATASASPFGAVATQTGQILGTLAYMAPEQLAGSPDAVDVRSDVYALGILLFELVEGRPPHELADKSPLDALRTIQEEPPRPSADTPRELGWIADKALAKEPERRYGSVSELAADLRRYLRGEPVLAGPPSVAYRLSKWIRRNPAKTAAAAIGIVSFVVIAWLLLQNVRSNRALSAERTNLTIANIALQAKTSEAEANAAQALENARVAKANERQAMDENERADREAEAAMKRADEVLRLSALQELDDLVAEADRLWPALPENVPRYEEWLRKADELMAELPDHERKLAELRANSMAWTEEEQARHRAEHPKLAELESAQRQLEHRRKLSAALETGGPARDPTPQEVGLDLLPTTAVEANELAWPLIDPDRKDWGGEAKGLVLARRAVELSGDLSPDERAGIRDSLAWALFANGRFDEAVAEEEQAFEEATMDRKQEFEGHVSKLKEKIEEEIAPEEEAEHAKHLVELEQRVAALEDEISTRPEWLFADAQDKWWHNQLGKLVSGLKSFSDEKTGLLSAGISIEHGWGLEKRLEFARSLRDGFGEGEFAKAWAKALPEIRNRHPDLHLTPQLGLVPLGPDPDSRLWEFSHLATGEPAVRGPDGRLVLKEETGLVFVLLPGGTFQMGAQSRDPNGRNYDPQARPSESPVHSVTLSPFLLSKYEMTQGQWLRLTGANPSRDNPAAYDRTWNREGSPGDLLHPVEQVSWTTCTHTLEQLRLLLPTEAQWEYAARAGTSSAWWTGAAKESLSGAANLADRYVEEHGGEGWNGIEAWLDDGNSTHARVGSYRANPFGLGDVLGNVWEWCRDGYDPSFYGQRADRDPFNPPVGSSNRVVRGGGFRDDASIARPAARRDVAPSFGVVYTGLRPAMTITP